MLTRRMQTLATIAATVLVVLALASPARSGEAAGKAQTGEIDWAKERRFWSFRAPESPPRPQVKDLRWPRQPLDLIVRARLEKRGLSPSPEVDLRTLVRRPACDLTGLPPAPEEVEAVASEGSAGALEALVESLLASPRFGERMASLWLPLARYGEDQAHQVGNDTKFFYPNAYLYRRWVIDSFNRDLPYDRFVRLQLAADRIDEASPGDLAALGFLGLGPKY